MNTLLVGFGFRARHGKDTLATMVAELFPAARFYPFATHLKCLARLLGMEGKRAGVLQQLGTACREMDPAYWIDLHRAWIAEEKPAIALIPDVRYVNEVRYITQAGGLVYRVDRLNPDGSLYTADDRDPSHPSESELVGQHLFDRYFRADSGDMEALRRAAVHVGYDIRDRLNHSLVDERMAG